MLGSSRGKLAGGPGPSGSPALGEPFRQGGARWIAAIGRTSRFVPAVPAWHHADCRARPGSGLPGGRRGPCRYVGGEAAGSLRDARSMFALRSARASPPGATCADAAGNVVIMAVVHSLGVLLVLT